MDPCIAVQRGRPTSTRRRVPVPVSSLSRGAKLGRGASYFVDSGTRGRLADPTRRDGKGAPPGKDRDTGHQTLPCDRSVRGRGRARAQLRETGKRRGRFPSEAGGGERPPKGALFFSLHLWHAPRRLGRARSGATQTVSVWKTNVRRRALTLSLRSSSFPVFPFICLRAAAARHHAARGKTLSHQSASHHPPISFRTTPRGNERTSLREGVVVVSHSRANVQRSLVRRKPRRTPYAARAV